MEEQASGWVDITLAPQPGAFKAQRSPQPGSVVVLTSACPPPRQALDWLSAAPAPAAPLSPGANPLRRALEGPPRTPFRSQEGCPLAMAASLGAAAPAPRLPGGQRLRVLMMVPCSMAAARKPARARRWRCSRGESRGACGHAPPDLDGAAAGVGMQASEAAAAQPGSMLSQIADCLDDDDEDGEISEAAAEAASLAAEAAVCSIEHRRPPRPGGAAAWLEPKDISAGRRAQLRRASPGLRHSSSKEVRPGAKRGGAARRKLYQSSASSLQVCGARHELETGRV